MSDQTSTPVVTQQLVQAKFNQKLIATKYNEALQYLTSLEVSQDNLATAQEAVKRGRAIVKKLDEIKTEGKAPSLQEGRWWDSMYKSLAQPIEEIITKKSSEIQKVGEKIAEENRKKEQEKQRVDGIKQAIDNFIVEQVKAIAECNSDDKIVSIEKLLGSHKANKYRYQEFLPDLVQKIEELSPLISKQKEHIREIERVEKEKAAALASGDDAKVLEMQEKQELLEHSLEESKVVLQETAISQMVNTAPVIAEEVLPVAKTRRVSWDFELVDEKKAFAKKMLVCEIDKEKAKLQLNVVKETMPKDQDEMIIDGIKYFRKYTF